MYGPPVEFAEEFRQDLRDDSFAARVFFDALAETANELCRAISPVDLPADVAFYCLHAVQLGGDAGSYIDANRCNAYTAAWLDLRLRPLLESQGRWCGRGVAMLLAEEWRLKVFGPGRHAWDGLLALVLHEYAHTLTNPIDWYRSADDGAPSLAANEKSLRESAKAAEIAGAAVVDCAPSESLAQHGFEFTRAALHLIHRARLVGCQLSIDNLWIAGRLYRMSDAADYRRAFDAELCETRLAQSVRELLTTEPPFEAARLWGVDAGRRVAGVL